MVQWSLAHGRISVQPLMSTSTQAMRLMCSTGTVHKLTNGCMSWSFGQASHSNVAPQPQRQSITKAGLQGQREF